MLVIIDPKTDRPVSSDLMKGIIEFCDINRFEYSNFHRHFELKDLPKNIACDVAYRLFEHLSIDDSISDLSNITVRLVDEGIN